MAIKSPPIGRSRLADIQSIKSKKFKPNKVYGDNTPIESEQIIPSKEMRMVANTVDAFLPKLNSSIK